MAAAAAALAAQQQLQQQQALRQAALEEQIMLEGIRAAVCESAEAEDAAAAIVELVVGKASDTMVSNHLDRLAIPYTVRCVVREALDFVRCAFVGQDSGFTTDRHWHADPVAPRVVVDPWARAAMSVAEPHASASAAGRHAAAAAGLLQKQGTAATLSSNNARSSASFLSPAAGGGAARTKSPTTAGVGAAASSKGGAAATAAASGGSKQQSGAAAPSAAAANAAVTKAVKKAGKSKSDGSASDQPGASGASGAGGGIGGGEGGAPTLEEQEYMARVREEQRRRAEAKATHERIARNLEEVKKDGAFTIDGATGRVIPIQAFDGGGAGGGRGGAGRRGVADAERFQILSGPAAAVAEGGLAPVKAPGRRGAPPGAPTGPSSAPAALMSSSTMSPAAAAVVGARSRSSNKKPDAADFYTEEASYGPMVEAVAAAGGVTVKGDKDNQTSKGGDLKAPKTRMSRSEYQKMASMFASQPIDDGFDTTPPLPTRPGGSPPFPPGGAPPPPQSKGPAATRSEPAPTAGLSLTASLPDAAAAEYRTQGVASLPLRKQRSLEPLAAATVPAGGGSPDRQLKRDAARKEAARLAEAKARRRGGPAIEGEPSLVVDEFN